MTDDARHQLWLIYCQLKDVEDDPKGQLELLIRSREQLGEVINQLNRQAEPAMYAALMANAGAKGGAAKTEAKAAAARTNGVKGGRPAGTYFCRECAPLSNDVDNERLIDCSESVYARKKKCTECGQPAYYRLD